MKRTLRLLLFLTFVFVLAGCGSHNMSLTAINEVEEDNVLLLSMYVPQDEQAISGTVTLQKGEVVLEVPLTISGSTATASVSGLQAGTWQLTARLRDQDNFVIYEGTREAVVETNGTISVNMHLEMTPGDATCTVNLANLTGVTSGVVKFKNGDVLVQEGALEIDDTQGTVVFTGLEARVWDIVVYTYDSSGSAIAYGQSSIQIMPGRMNYVSIDLEQGSGDLTIEVTWTLPPAFPANVSATLVDDHIEVTWTANTEPDVVGYRVYRSLAETGPFVRISGILVEGTQFTDVDVYPGNTYWYQVIAIRDDGDDSGFDDMPVSVSYTETSPILNTSIDIDYDASSGLLPGSYNPSWSGGVNGFSVSDNELIINIPATSSASYCAYSHAYSTTDKLYMKSIAKYLGGTDTHASSNIIISIANGMYRVGVRLVSGGIAVNDTIVEGIDTSIYHTYEATLQSDSAEVFVDGVLVWSGGTTSNTYSRFVFGDGASSSGATYIAVTKVECGIVIE